MSKLQELLLYANLSKHGIEMKPVFENKIATILKRPSF